MRGLKGEVRNHGALARFTPRTLGQVITSMLDCLIIGGGVIGLSLAWDLARHGRRVRVIDRAEPGKAASWAGAGILPAAPAKNWSDPLDALAALSHRLHPEWSAALADATGVDNGFRRSGGLYVARSGEDAERLERAAQEWERQGIHVRRCDVERLAEIEPGLRGRSSACRDIVAAYRLPDEAQLRNPRHVAALQVACSAAGVEITSGMPAEGFELDRERLTAVVTERERVRADSICLTAGCWSGSLLRGLGHPPAMKPVRGQMVLLRLPAPPLRHIVNEGPRYLVPRADGRVLVGSTEEDAGFDCRTTGAAIRELLELALGLAPALAEANVEKTWAGLRPGTGDGLPVLGRIPGTENAFVAAGHFRSGLWLSPGTAVVMSRLIRGEEPEVDLLPFRLDRKSLRVRQEK